LNTFLFPKLDFDIDNFRFFVGGPAMKAIKILLKTLLFLVGILVSIWIFMPWKQVGEVALLAVGRQLKTPVAWSAIGNVPGGFLVEDLDVQKLMGMVDVSFKTLTIVPDLTASLLSMAPTCRISFTGSTEDDIAVTPLKKIPCVVLDYGGVTLSLNDQGILLDAMRSDGEISMRGSLLLSLSAERLIRWADVALEVKSEPFEKELPSLQMSLGLPLEQEAPGRWSLRRTMENNEKT
jgi:hypothetical protein